MIGSTLVEYNGIEIRDCQTQKFDQVPVYDSSGQVLLHDEFTVRVVGYFMGKDYSNPVVKPQPTDISADNPSAGGHYLQVHERLLERRKPFKMTLGHGGPVPQVILQANPLGLTSESDPEDVTLLTDVNSGPHPKVISFQQISGNAVIRIEWEVVVCLLPSCPYIGGGEDAELGELRRRGLLSNRWSCTDEVDENFWTVRTWNGELRLAHPWRNPHDFRGLCVPDIQPGMRREKMSFVASEDGLKLRYTVIDREVYMTAPEPAHSMKYGHREIVAEHAINVRTIFNLSLQGDRTAAKSDLVSLAMAVAEAKLKINQRVPPAGVDEARPVRLLSWELFEQSGTDGSNEVQLTVNLLHTQGKQQDANALKSRIDAEFGKKLDGTMIQGYVNTLSKGNRPGETPKAYGAIPLVGAFSAFLQTPCTDDRSINAGISVSASEYDSIYQTRKDRVGADALPDIDGVIVNEFPDLIDYSYSDSHRNAIYQTYDIDTHDSMNAMVVQLPVASSTFGLQGEAGSNSLGGLSTETATSTEPGGSSGTGNPVLQPNSASTESSSEIAASSVFTRIGPPQYFRTIRIVAERHGEPPILPDVPKTFQDPDGVRHFLKGGGWLTNEPKRTPEGNARDYTIRGEWLFGLDRPPGSVRFGAPDYEAQESPGLESPSRYVFSLTSIFSSHQSIG